MAGNSWFNHNECLQSCALAGAAAMAAGITDAYIVANGPTWCYFYAMKVTDRPGLNLGQRFLCTYPTNGAIVFGSEKEVLQTLSDLAKLPTQPGLVLVENSCAFSLIGDDLPSIVGTSDLTCPILTMDSGGTLGDFWQGYSKALLDLLKITDFDETDKDEGQHVSEDRGQYVSVNTGTDATVRCGEGAKNEFTVNLIGCSVTYYNELDDLAELERLLNMVGIKVNLSLAVNHSMADLQHLQKADLNVVVHPELGHEAAEWLSKKLSMPYIEPVLPYGLEGTKTWVSEVVRALNKNMEAQLEPLLSEIQGEFTYVAHDDSKTKPNYYSYVQGHDWQAALQTGNNSLLLGSDQERRLIVKEKSVAFQTISNPEPAEIVLSERPFMGIKGHRAMQEIIWNLYINSLETAGKA